MADKTTDIEVRTGEVDTKIDKQYGEDVNWHRYRTLIGRNFAPHKSLESFRDLSKTKNLEMKVNIEGHLYDVQLPTEMMARLARYLSNKDYPFDKGMFDCVSFVHWMLDEPYEYASGVNMEKFDMERLHSDWDIKPGDVIQMSAGDKYVNNSGGEHAMVYIGHGLYLSKPGEKNGLSVHKLYQLQEMYGQLNLFRQTRKRETEGR